MAHNIKPVTYYSAAQLAKRYSVTLPTIWRWAQSGTLPKPISLSPGCTRWASDELEIKEQEWRQRRR